MYIVRYDDMYVKVRMVKKVEFCKKKLKKYESISIDKMIQIL